MTRLGDAVVGFRSAPLTSGSLVGGFCRKTSAAVLPSSQKRQDGLAVLRLTFVHLTDESTRSSRRAKRTYQRWETWPFSRDTLMTLMGPVPLHTLDPRRIPSPSASRASHDMSLAGSSS